MPGADIIIPTYNDPGFLPRAVQSALAQPFAARIIIADDGSSPLVDLSSFPPDDRITLIHQQNAGPSAARNRALDESSAPFVIFLDADDQLLPTSEHSLALAQQHGAAVVSARIDTEQGKPDRDRPAPTEWVDKAIPEPDAVFTPIALFGASGLIVPRVALDAGVRFDTNLKHGEDREFIRRVADQIPVFVSPHPVIRCTIHPNEAENLCSPSHLARRTRDFLYIVEKHNSPTAAPRFAQTAKWLVNQIAKHGADADAWRMLSEACRKHNWPIPLKARLRHALRGRP